MIILLNLMQMSSKMKRMTTYFTLFFLVLLNSMANDPAVFKTTKEHEVFSQFEGKWKVIVNSYDIAGNIVTTYSGKAEINTEMKNRYLDFKFDFSNPESDYIMNWHFGYDVNCDKYVLFQRNNLYSFPFYGVGDYDADENTFAFLTNDYDKRGNKLKVLIKWVRDDKFLLELHNFTIKKAERLIEEYALIKLDK